MDLQRANESGGSGSSRQYKRDPKGTSTGGQFTAGGATQSAASTPTHIYAPRPKKGGGGGSSQASLPASSKFKTLSPGGDNDPAAVAEMQQLLSALGLGTVEANGQYDEATQNAVMEAQKRLGIKPNGKANKGLVNKLLNAYDLSPCVKRSEDPDPADLIRSDPQCEFTVTRSEDDVYDTLRASVDEDDEEPVARAYTRPRDEPDDEPEPTHSRPEIMRYDRSWALDDIVIRSGGDGRTVEAYAAVFETPSEIKDQHGHYMEVISRSAFNRAISHGINRINVFYNHGLTVHGTSDALGSVPIGSPVDVRPDGRGLRTVTRFNRSPLAESVLEAIRAGDIRGYSFRGRIFQSNPPRVPRFRTGAGLPTITRTELGLAEYGPTPTPAYAEAGIVAVRSLESLAATLASLRSEERDELVRMITASTPLDSETGTATPAVGLGTEDSPEGHSGRFKQLQQELRELGVLK